MQRIRYYSNRAVFFVQAAFSFSIHFIKLTHQSRYSLVHLLWAHCDVFRSDRGFSLLLDCFVSPKRFPFTMMVWLEFACRFYEYLALVHRKCSMDAFFGSLQQSSRETRCRKSIHAVGASKSIHAVGASFVKESHYFLSASIP